MIQNIRSSNIEFSTQVTFISYLIFPHFKLSFRLKIFLEKAKRLRKYLCLDLRRKMKFFFSRNQSSDVYQTDFKSLLINLKSI